MFAINAIKSLIKPSLVKDVRLTQVAHKFGYGPNRPRLRVPIWFYPKELKRKDHNITESNEKFIQQTVHEKYGKPVIRRGVQTNEKASSLLKKDELPAVEWRNGLMRTGLIGKKIGIVPLWLKNGKKIMTTMLQVLDNHVIKYVPPEHNNPSMKIHLHDYSKHGMLYIGSGNVDPNKLTANYAGLFEKAGVMPKQNLNRFQVSPDAALLPGTELSVLHFRVGDHVDVRGKTIDRGFQGVMKRWGFKGQPATHGATKTHRRPGSIGGGLRARVWPGKKMPGHMGHRWRIARGLKIWRINKRFNTMWVSGLAIPGDTNSLVYIYDTVLPLKKVKNPHFPTFTGDESSIPEDQYDEEVHRFDENHILYEPED